MKSQYSRFVIYGNSFQSSAMAGYLIRILKVPPSQLLLLTKETYHSYEYGLLNLGLGRRERDEVEKPVLKCFSELMEINFDFIRNINFNS